MKIEIACPGCNWKPDGQPHWECSCGFVWNTFETAGKCPGCGMIWEETQCPRSDYPPGCGAWSKHIDWYRNLDDQIRTEIEKVLQWNPA